MRRWAMAASCVALGAVSACFWPHQPSDLVMGNWVGQCDHGDGTNAKLEAQIVAHGGERYRAILTVAHGDRSKTVDFPMTVKRDGGKIAGSATVSFGDDFGGDHVWTATFDNGKLAGQSKHKDGSLTFAMTRVEKKPPTLGAKPPAGAVVLFDGTAESRDAHWRTRAGKPAPWTIVDGAMEVNREDIVSVEAFGDCTLHLEFRTPFMPEARGQKRGNSGVYLHGRYEVQVLDSFGLPPKDDEAGGIYSLAVPRVNPCLPPEEWQTYDFTFVAPKVDAEGKVLEVGTVSVDFNGVRIHDGVKLEHATPGGVTGDIRGPGGLLLQNHGNPVRFRNIWFVPKKA